MPLQGTSYKIVLGRGEEYGKESPFASILASLDRIVTCCSGVRENVRLFAFAPRILQRERPFVKFGRRREIAEDLVFDGGNEG